MSDSDRRPPQDSQSSITPSHRRSPLLIGAFIAATVLLLVLLSAR